MARRKMSMPNRIINLALLALAFARPIQIFLAPIPMQAKLDTLLFDATAGLVRGSFDKDAALKMYGPVGAAFVLFEVKKMAMKKFRF